MFLLVSTRCPSGMKSVRAKRGFMKDPTTKEEVRKYEFTLQISIKFHFSFIFILIRIRFLFFLLFHPWSYLHNWKLRSDGWFLVSTLRLGRFRYHRAERTKRSFLNPREEHYSKPSSQVNEIWRCLRKLQLPFYGNSKIMVDPQWNGPLEMELQS